MAEKLVFKEGLMHDATHEEKLAAKFVNCVMRDGKRMLPEELWLMR